MILPGTRKVQLSSILVPKGFKERKKLAHIPSRMESIKRHGLINLIVIQDRTKKLLAGGDRLTALLALKVKTHEVRVFRGTEEEFEALQIAENIERRHNDDVDALTKRYVELTRGEIEKAEVAEHVHDFQDVYVDGDEVTQACACGATRVGGPEVSAVKPPDPAPRPVGRPKTATGKAREAVAAATGKTPEAIRQAEKRAVAKEKKAAEPLPPPSDPFAPPVPLVETYGLPLLRDYDAYQVAAAQEALKKLDVDLTRILEAFDRRVGVDTLAGAICRDAATALSEAILEARNAYPRAACPDCKRIPARTAKCGVCSHTGFVGVTKWLGAPDELRQGGDEAKVSDGKGGFVPYARAVAKEEERREKSTPAKGARRLTVEMDGGEVMHGVREGD